MNLDSIETQWLGSNLDYLSVLQLQQERAEAIYNHLAGPILYLLEHSPVYTIGRTRDKSSLLSTNSDSYPIVEVSRGGQATYHGPGQLVGYLLLNLSSLEKDLHKYVRTLERTVIEACKLLGASAESREAFTGVWCEGKKLASIGIGVKKWVTLHGFGLNVTQESLRGFRQITPCGIQDVKMTYLNEFLENPKTVREVSELISSSLKKELRETFLTPLSDKDSSTLF